MGTETLKMGREYKNQREMYPLTPDLKSVDFSKVKTDVITITSYETNQSRSRLGGALREALEKAKIDKKLISSMVRATLARAVDSGFNVNNVRAGESFSISDNTLHYRSDKQLLQIPLSDTFDRQKIQEYTLQRKTIKEQTRQEWETILDADMSHILFDSMSARGIRTDVPANYRMVWRQTQDMGEKFIPAMKAHGDKRLVAALESQPDFLKKRYKGSALQHLAMIEYLRVFGLDKMIDDVEKMEKKEPAQKETKEADVPKKPEATQEKKEKNHISLLYTLAFQLAAESAGFGELSERNVESKGENKIAYTEDPYFEITLDHMGTESSGDQYTVSVLNKATRQENNLHFSVVNDEKYLQEFEAVPAGDRDALDAFFKKHPDDKEHPHTFMGNIDKIFVNLKTKKHLESGASKLGKLTTGFDSLLNAKADITVNGITYGDSNVRLVPGTGYEVTLTLPGGHDYTVAAPTAEEVLKKCERIDTNVHSVEEAVSRASKELLKINIRSSSEVFNKIPVTAFKRSVVDGEPYMYVEMIPNDKGEVKMTFTHEKETRSQWIKPETIASVVTKEFAKHGENDEVESTRKQLGGMLSKMGYRGTPEKNVKLKSGEFSYTYTGNNLPPLRVTYTVYPGNNNDTADVELMSTHDSLGETFEGDVNEIAEKITSRLTEIQNENLAGAEFTKRTKTFEVALNSAEKRGLIEVPKDESLPEGSYHFTIKDGAKRYEVEVSTDRSAKNFSLESFNGQRLEKGAECTNFAECVKTAVDFGRKSPDTQPQNNAEKQSAEDAEASRVEASTSHASLVRKASKIGTEVSTSGDVWVRNVDTDSQFGSQHVSVQLLEGKGLRLYSALPDGTKLDVVKVTTNEALSAIKVAFKNVEDFRNKVREALVNPSLVPETFHRAVTETTFAEKPMFVIQSKDSATRIMISQYPQHETPPNQERENRFMMVKMSGGQVLQPKYDFSPENLIKDALTNGPEK